MTKRLAELDHWNFIHKNRVISYEELDDSYKNYCDKLIFEKIAEFFLGKSIIEIGAGSSDWLIRLSKKLNPKTCVGLDYSEEGCLVLKKKAYSAHENINIVLSDFFAPPDPLKNTFDFVMSFGVVEHFLDLSDTLKAISQYAKPNGIVFTLIPNMVGINGLLVKILNRKIYDIHVPHDIKSFELGHSRAGLEILWSGYVCSNNFGVLSSCFENEQGFSFWLYKQLTRLSKLIWFFESKIFPLPTSKTFSPYIVVASRVTA